MAVDDVHLSGYQARDHEVVDYELASLADTGLTFRGPLPELGTGDHFACVGAAQTFGCFCPRPYPSLVAVELGLPVLNLGYGGAGPEFFAMKTSLHPYLNRARFVVLQVMSGRSQSNSLFDCDGLEYVTRRSDGKGMGAQRALFEHLLPGPASIAGVRTPTRLRQRLPNPGARRKLEPLIDEMRAGWLDSYRTLLAAIDVPVVLLWFSKRQSAYQEDYRSIPGLLGEFPQLVQADMIAELQPLVDHYVECVTERGSPQPLYSRFTGEPVVVDPADDRPDLGGRLWTHNRYYPSPEMHEDAAALLTEVCRALAVPERNDGTQR